MKPERIQDALVELPGWKAELPSQTLVSEVTFPDIHEALSFVGYLDELVGSDGRLKEILLRGNRLRIVLGDQPGGELTSGDLALAGRMAKLFELCDAQWVDDVN